MDIRSMDYRFIADGANAIKLCVGRSRKALVTLVRDEKYPSMWRIKRADGLSDMVTLTRAKDAALDFADRYLRQKAGESAGEARENEFGGPPLPHHPPEAKPSHGGPRRIIAG
jgi:hypothetical protein